MRELLTIPNPILRQGCKTVEHITPEIRSLAEDLKSHMLAPTQEGEIKTVSLSAPQLGELVRVIAFFYNPEYREEDGIEVVVNPVLSKLTDFAKVEETCLSLPKRKFIVERAKKAKLTGLNLNGEPRSYKGRDLVAQIMQHEVNHLDGILIDRIGEQITSERRRLS